MTNDGWGNEWPVEPKLDKEAIEFEKVFPFMKVTDSNTWPKGNAISVREITEYKPIEGQPITKDDLAEVPKFIGWNLASQNDVTSYHYLTDEKPFNITGHVVCNVDKDGNIDLTPLREKLKSQGSNLVDDQAYLYFQCEGCNDILDPQTKSFAKLRTVQI